MLRRQPTAIKVTTNDLALYEDFRRQQEAGAAGEAASKNPLDQQRGPAPGTIDPRTRQRAREERIGLGSRH